MYLKSNANYITPTKVLTDQTDKSMFNFKCSNFNIEKSPSRTLRKGVVLNASENREGQDQSPAEIQSDGKIWNKDIQGIKNGIPFSLSLSLSLCLCHLCECVRAYARK